MSGQMAVGSSARGGAQRVSMCGGTVARVRRACLGEILQRVSDDIRLVVSEPIGDLPGAWNEVPEAIYWWWKGARPAAALYPQPRRRPDSSVRAGRLRVAADRPRTSGHLALIQGPPLGDC